VQKIWKTGILTYTYIHVPPPRTKGGGGGVHTRRVVKGWGVNILEDIGLAFYSIISLREYLSAVDAIVKFEIWNTCSLFIAPSAKLNCTCCNRWNS
jgi:hypothetical protein